jgi:hypothetical protein
MQEIEVTSEEFATMLKEGTVEPVANHQHGQEGQAIDTQEVALALGGLHLQILLLQRRIRELEKQVKR